MSFSAAPRQSYQRTPVLNTCLHSALPKAIHSFTSDAMGTLCVLALCKKAQKAGAPRHMCITLPQLERKIGPVYPGLCELQVLVYLRRSETIRDPGQENKMNIFVLKSWFPFCKQQEDA